MRNSTGLVKRLPPVEKLEVSQARNFSGGLNTFDTPLNLASRYVTSCRNLYPDTNGRLRLRFGTSLFCDLAGLIDEAIAMTYFGTNLIVASKDGKLTSIDASGTATVRWSPTIAAGLGVAAWSSGLTFVSFTQFAGHLVICNGVDKPLDMTSVYSVNYLIDAGTGANTNVPRAKVCVTHNNYLVLANTPTDKTTLYIGMKGTAGTFEGDPGPDNDGVNFITNTYINQGSPDILGLASFRDKLIVTFPETLLAVQLGEYVTTDHTPRVDDVIENHGAISHNTIVPLGDDILFMDQAGMASVQRALITATLSPVRESLLVGTDLQVAMAKFTPAQLEQYVFAVHDRIQQHVLFFVPKSATVLSTTDCDVFVYCFDKSQKFRAWSKFDQMAYRCGTRTTEGRVFLGSGTNVFYYHNQFEPLYNDYAEAGLQAWDDGTPWDDLTLWTEISAGVGRDIPYSFQLPWTDLRKPAIAKLSKYVAMDVEGTGQFTLKMSIDGFSGAENSMTFNMTLDPADTTYYARPINNMQLYAWPQKFTQMRMSVEGAGSNYIAFVTIQLAYLAGTVRR